MPVLVRVSTHPLTLSALTDACLRVCTHPFTLSALMDACLIVHTHPLTLSVLMDVCGQMKTQHNDTLSGHTEAAHR